LFLSSHISQQEEQKIGILKPVDSWRKLYVTRYTPIGHRVVLSLKIENRAKVWPYLLSQKAVDKEMLQGFWVVLGTRVALKN
jgi:hypothetical protein